MCEGVQGHVTACKGPAGSGGQAVAYLSIPVPTNLRQAICFQLDTNQEMAPLKYPIGSAKIPYWLK